MLDSGKKGQSSELDSATAFDWRTIYHVLRERRWLIALCILLGVVGGFVYTEKATPLYGAYGVLQIDQQQEHVVVMEEVRPQDLTSEEYMNTLIQTMTNGGAFRRVVEKLQLQKNPKFMPPPKTGENQVGDAVEVLSKSVSGSLRKGTRLVDITALHPDAELARVVADAVMDEAIASSFRQRTETAQKANDMLLLEAQRLQTKLTKSEQAVHNFRKDNNALSLNDRQDIVIQQLNDANSKLSNAKGERVKLEADMAKARALRNQPSELIQIPSIAEHPTVANFKGNIASKERELAVAAKRYKPKHPAYISIATEVDDLKRGLDKTVLDVADQLDEAYNKAHQLEDDFSVGLKEQEGKQLELNKLTIDYNILVRELEADKALYDSVLARMKEVGVSKNINDTPIHVAEAAWSSSTPVEPNGKKIILASLMGGIVLGVGLALALSMLDNSLKTVDEAETTLNLPVLSAIPQISKQSRIEKSALAVINEPRGQAAEAIRSLRTSLSLLGTAKDRRTFLFTSAISGEGKSFAAANYAAALAQQGLSTLLIDADLREPMLSEVFLKDPALPGLAEYLADQGGLNAAVQTEVPNLHFLPSGFQVPNPAELLANMRFDRLIQEALTKFDRVIVDSAPIIPVSDTLLLAPSVQSVCLLVRAGYTSKRAALRACRALRDISCKPVGLIFNCVPQNSHGFYYAYNPKNTYGREGIYGTTRRAAEKAPSV